MDEFERLLNEGDKAYKKNDFTKAVLCYEDAFKLVTSDNKNRFKSILPMMGLCYRRIGNSASVINLAAEAKKKLGREFITSVFNSDLVAYII